MAHTYPPGHCPDGCSGGHSNRQMIVNEGMLGQFPANVQANISAHGGAKRCTYCGLVYLSPAPQFVARLGFWDSGVRGQGWTR